MSPSAELKGRTIRLRRPSPEDVNIRFNLGRHAEIVRGFGGSFDSGDPYTLADAQAAIRLIEDDAHAWVIDAGRYIGQVRFHSIDHGDRRAALAVGIDDPRRLGQGLGTEAVRLALSHGFRSGLHRVTVRVVAYNARAIACYLKCGFVEEGREREAALVDGVRHDDVIMGLLAREFVSDAPGSRPVETEAAAEAGASPSFDPTEIDIRPLSVDLVDSFHHALDTVARERRYLTFTEAPSLAHTREFVLGGQEKGDPRVVAVAAGKVVGWCDIGRHPFRTHAHRGTLGMGVMPGFRRRGVGVRLITAALDGAWAAGLTRVELTVYADNSAAVALYEKVGFVREGIVQDAVCVGGHYRDGIAMAVLRRPR